MTRRASLPGADELFRKTDQEPRESRVAAAPEPAIEPPVLAPPVQAVQPSPTLAKPQAQSSSQPASAAPLSTSIQVPKAPSGRHPRHDEKVTFYCTGEELTRIERARLTLRAEHKMASDRGRIIRAAVAAVLDEFETLGSDSVLVRRLNEF